MPLTAISTDRYLRSGIDQAKIALICNALYPFINEIEINLDPSA
jgi:hypothetical protein